MSEPVSSTAPNADDRGPSGGKSHAKFRLQLVVLNDSGHEQVEEVVQIDRDEMAIETLGLTLAEGKLILKRIQENVIREQIQDALLRQRNCTECGKARHSKGHHDITIRTLFGNIELKSPRLEHCRCQPHAEKTFSPLQAILPEHTCPEMLYLEVKWSSLLPYEVSCDLLHEVLPVNEKLSAVTIRNHLFEVAERIEQDLGEERPCLIEGCEQDWEQLPIPDGPLTVGLDGGFVRARHKRGCFEVIVGKSVLEFKRDDPEAEKSRKCFGFVQTYDGKPKRRLFELLKEQGMQMNQQVKFFSDGGADIRDMQLYLNPEAEHYLDWFHVTMRITVMGQYAKGLKTTEEKREEGFKLLESTKHYLWHGNVVRAREKIEETLGFLDDEEIRGDNVPKFRKALDEFDTYIKANQGLIPNYGEFWRNEETIATGFVESAANQIVSKRFAKLQQMERRAKPAWS